MSIEEAFTFFLGAGILDLVVDEDGGGHGNVDDVDRHDHVNLVYDVHASFLSLLVSDGIVGPEHDGSVEGVLLPPRAGDINAPSNPQNCDREILFKAYSSRCVRETRWFGGVSKAQNGGCSQPSTVNAEPDSESDELPQTQSHLHRAVENPDSTG